MSSHIKISHHGIYYFRIVIPQRLRLYFGGKLEIKKFLKTTVWRVARLLTLKAEFVFGEAERQQMAGSPPDIGSEQFFGLILNVDLKSGTLRVESDPNNPEDGKLALQAAQELAPAHAEWGGKSENSTGVLLRINGLEFKRNFHKLIKCKA